MPLESRELLTAAILCSRLSSCSNRRQNIQSLAQRKSGSLNSRIPANRYIDTLSVSAPNSATSRRSDHGRCRGLGTACRMNRAECALAFGPEVVVLDQQLRWHNPLLFSLRAVTPDGHPGRGLVAVIRLAMPGVHGNSSISHHEVSRHQSGRLSFICWKRKKTQNQSPDTRPMHKTQEFIP